MISWVPPGERFKGWRFAVEKLSGRPAPPNDVGAPQAAPGKAGAAKLWRLLNPHNSRHRDYLEAQVRSGHTTPPPEPEQAPLRRRSQSDSIRGVPPEALLRRQWRFARRAHSQAPLPRRRQGGWSGDPPCEDARLRQPRGRAPHLRHASGKDTSDARKLRGNQRSRTLGQEEALAEGVQGSADDMPLSSSRLHSWTSKTSTTLCGELMISASAAAPTASEAKAFTLAVHAPGKSELGAL